MEGRGAGGRGREGGVSEGKVRQCGGGPTLTIDHFRYHKSDVIPQPLFTDNSNQDQVLREVQGELVNSEDCSDMWGTQLDHDMICFGDGTRGPCAVSQQVTHTLDVDFRHALSHISATMIFKLSLVCLGDQTGCSVINYGRDVEMTMPAVAA